MPHNSPRPSARPHYVLIDPLATRKRWYPRLSSGILYDLGVCPDPRTVRLATHSSTYDDIDLLEPATEESSRRLRVVIKPLSNIELMVDVRNNSYVSIGQLLWMIAVKLREPVSYTDMHKLTRRDRRRAQEQFEKRVNSSSRSRQSHEHQRGTRYIDLLLGKTNFLGLKPDWKGRDIFELVLAKDA